MLCSPQAPEDAACRARPLRLLPKAHLHLHFAGSMRHSTLVDLAREHRVHLPEALVEDWPPRLEVWVTLRAGPNE